MSWILGAILALLTIVSQCVRGPVTHYGESYQGQQMGCVGSGLYDTNNPVIIASSPYGPYECGNKILIIGPVGSLVGFMVDTCPGCPPGQLDLSEAGIAQVCGPGADYCVVYHTEIPR